VHLAQIGERIYHEGHLLDRVEAGRVGPAGDQHHLVVVLGIAAHEGEVHAGATLAVVGDHQAEDLGVEALHPVPVLHVDAHVGQARVDVRHGSILLIGQR
jgi:hypothetical protein